MMTMRASYVPEELRSTIINCFRIPLNMFVCIILYNVSVCVCVCVRVFVRVCPCVCFVCAFCASSCTCVCACV